MKYKTKSAYICPSVETITFDLEGIPPSRGNMPIMVLPFIKYGFDYMYGTPQQFTLNVSE